MITYMISGFILLLISMFSLFMAFPKKFDFPIGFSDILKKLRACVQQLGYQQANRSRLRAHEQHVKWGNEQRANRACELHDRVLDKAYAAKEKLRVPFLGNIQGLSDKARDSRRRENNKANEYAVGVINSFLRSKMARIENIQAISTPFVEFCVLDSSTRGQYYSPGKIQLSDILLNRSRNDIQEIIIHEVAHHIDMSIRGISCHDSYWEAIHHSCGGRGNYLASHGITGGTVPNLFWHTTFTFNKAYAVKENDCLLVPDESIKYKKLVPDESIKYERKKLIPDESIKYERKKLVEKENKNGR